MHHHSNHAPAEQEIKDPICGMNVDPQSAISYEYKGQTYYFCSDHCRTKFQAEPAKFAPSPRGCCS